MREVQMTSRDEPFDGLFTQGMVCHETYRAADGTWLLPEEIKRLEGGAVVRASDNAPVTIGRSEKMSKSKKNVVDPDEIIRDYGADTARWFMLSDSPPERDLEWTEAGVSGAWRFQQRLYRLLSEAIGSGTSSAKANGTFSDQAMALRRAAHKAAAGISGDIEAFHFNKAVARLYELANAIEGFKAMDDADRAALAETLDIFVRLIAPMTPHLAEELWTLLGRDGFVADASWPTPDAALLADEDVTMAVQVNGKLRATLKLPKDTPKEKAEAAALAEADVIKAMAGKPAKKIVVVPNRIVNVVV
jgi:leucyl-tRNA synthetase